ncbi:hypothetical protein CEP88_09105 [Roseobacter denitrificans]|uniref:Uncharacterized protein n=1 Tax=Roseobacter denitrificans (strain ATCC 33942 / OCh 114) TaxID=375451 RepID=Q161C3_ROSDO|nr:hypothetical protein [Roseobacter denitrificans]ABG33420.1 hypothetical protein RD1_3966 [Roseobacter denitrificans OCh 114]AVL52740.1 hypothetical protein CEP88_09105 [Roseobacter denitrificans]SFG24217.1 hypothetical protein SAMN05443635_110146 [Roseobacter denitrificans OCh 114]
MKTERKIVQMVFCTADSVTGANIPEAPDEGPAKLRQAAKLVESTAYASAGEHPTSVVSQLIMAAANLERLAQFLERKGEHP